jgi:hypothetical protein
MRSEPGLHPLLVLFLAPFAGALVTLSLAPFDFWPAGIISCAIYAFLLCTCSLREAVWRSWLFGLGLFGSGVSWVYVSIHVYGGAGVVLASFLTVLFCAGLAVLFQVSFGWFYVRFVRALPGGEAFRQHMNTLDRIDEQLRAVNDFFEQLSQSHDRLPEADTRDLANTDTADQEAASCMAS